MPKGFSEREKAIIRSALLAKGRELFGAYGLKRTNVEDITRAAGISKGAFYLFFGSKEELFFEILEQFEVEYQAQLLAESLQPGLTPTQSLKAALRRALLLWRAHPLFAQLGSDDIAHLLRKLPAEKTQAHLQRDVNISAQLIAHWQQLGLAIESPAEVVSGLMKAVVLLSLHESDIGSDVFPAVRDILIDLIAGYIAGAYREAQP